MNDHAIHRRTFIRRALGTGTALALPNILTRPLFGAPSANGTIQIGLIGCGGIANYHKSHLTQMGDVRIIAVADAYQQRREKFAADCPDRRLRAKVACRCAHRACREIRCRN